MVAEWNLVVDGGMRVLSDGVMVVGVESCGWSVVAGDELTTSRGDDVYLTFLECRGKGRASAAKSQRGVELREGTECGLRTESRPTGCEAQRRDGNGSMAARTGHFCLPLVRGALGVPDEQSRPGPWPLGTGSGREPFAHPSVAPQPNSGAAIGADVPAASGFGVVSTRQKSRPRPTPCPVGPEGFLWASHRAQRQRSRNAGERGFWMASCSPSVGSPGAAIRRHQATGFRELPDVDKDCGGACDGTARLLPSLPPPPPVFFVRTRRLLGDEEAPRGGHFSLPEASGRSRAIATAMEHRKQREKVVGDDGRSAFGEVFLHGGPHPWVDDERVFLPSCQKCLDALALKKWCDRRCPLGILLVTGCPRLAFWWTSDPSPIAGNYRGHWARPSLQPPRPRRSRSQATRPPP